MSQYFKDATTRVTLWNPATRVAQMFFRMTEALEPYAERPCGVVDLGYDEYDVDPEVFAAFVDTLAGRYLASNHPILKSMIAGYLPAAVVMVERSGRTLKSMIAAIERSHEAISLHDDAFDPAGDTVELRRSAEAAARAMPT